MVAVLDWTKEGTVNGEGIILVIGVEVAGGVNGGVEVTIDGAVDWSEWKMSGVSGVGAEDGVKGTEERVLAASGWKISGSSGFGSAAC